PANGAAASFADLGLPEANAIFSSSEEAAILNWLQQGTVSSDNLRAKLQIVIEERRNYDPKATLEALHSHAPDTTLYIDTVQHGPSEIASQVITWLTP